jgi:hypothetical protein
MNLPPNDSPVWPIVRVAVRAVILAACLACFYKQVDIRDVMTVVVMILSDGALTASATKASG